MISILEHKSDAAAAFMKQVERQFGVKVCVLHTDNGGEYTNNKLKLKAAEEGWIHETTATHNPERNGPTQRINR